MSLQRTDHNLRKTMMQLLKKIVTNALILLSLSFSLTISAAAEELSEQGKKTISRIYTLANQGNADSQYMLATLYQQNQDHHKAFEWFEKSALQGNENSQSKVGLMYYVGVGVRQNYSKAFEFSLKAANKQMEASYLSVAVMYQKGQGVRQDYRKAKEWYGKSCDSVQ